MSDLLLINKSYFNVVAITKWGVKVIIDALPTAEAAETRRQVFIKDKCEIDVWLRNGHVETEVQEVLVKGYTPREVTEPQSAAK